MCDTTAPAELSARDEVLRIRTFEHDDHLESIVAWKGPTLRSPDGYKLREEIELPLAAATVEPGRLLTALGYAPVYAIERVVEVFAVAGAAVRLETYPAHGRAARGGGRSRIHRAAPSSPRAFPAGSSRRSRSASSSAASRSGAAFTAALA